MPKGSRKRTSPSRLKLGVKKGDRVRVMTGDWRGAEGVIRSVDLVKGRVTIEGVNMVKRHMRKSQRHPQGGVIEKEAPVHASNVRVIERA